jgi:hypothetical protein
MMPVVLVVAVAVVVVMLRQSKHDDGMLVEVILKRNKK